MGNNIVCCPRKWSQLSDSDEKLTFNNFELIKPQYHLNSEFSGQRNARSISTVSVVPEDGGTPFWDKTKFSIQHISEREPEDCAFDPSMNSSCSALFMSCLEDGLSGECHVPSSTNRMLGSHSLLQNDEFDINVNTIRKRWSSCSTIHHLGDVCLVNPDQSSALWNVSVAVVLLVNSDRNKGLIDGLQFLTDDSKLNTESCKIYHDVYTVFDDRIYPVVFNASSGVESNPTKTLNIPPTVKSVHQFLCSLFTTALLGPECAIVSMIFLERLVNAAEVGIFPWSWRRQLLACVLLASKVLDDQAIWNTDFCKLLRGATIEDINSLERQSLALLQFNIDVPFAVYARYYFDLLTVGEVSGLISRQPGESRHHRITPEPKGHCCLLPTSNNESIRTTDSILPSSIQSTRLSPASGPLKIIKQGHDSSDVKKSTSVDAVLSSDSNLKNKSTKQQQQFNPLVRRCTNDNKCSKFGVSEIDLDLSSDVHNPYYSEKTHLIPTADLIDFHDPLQLDEETERVNFPSALRFSSSPNVEPNKASHFGLSKPNVYNLMFGSRQPVQKSPQSPVWAVSDPSHNLPNHVPSANSHTVIKPRSTTSTTSSNHMGFIRSIMGGDVAYTLLRDAGMY